MKLILLSDGHLCVDKPAGRLDSDMLLVGLSKLDYVFGYAYEHDISNILQAGDFVDVRRSWELLAALSKFLDEWKKKGVHLNCVLGQHDSYYHDMINQKTIVGVLISSGLINRLTAAGNSAGNFLLKEGDTYVYGASYGDPIPSPRLDHLNELTGTNILVVHRQILMKKEWAQQEQFDYAPEFLNENKDYDLILCGDAHQKFDFKSGNRIICNAGVMMRLEATENNINHQPGFYVYDTEEKSLWYKYIACAAKGEEVLSRDHILKQKNRKQNFDEFINKVRCTEGENKSLSFDRNLRLLMNRSNTSSTTKRIVSEYMAEVQ